MLQGGLVQVVQLSAGVLFPCAFMPKDAGTCEDLVVTAWISYQGPYYHTDKKMPEFSVYHEMPPGFVLALHSDGFIGFQMDPVPFSGLEDVPCGKGRILQPCAV